MPQQPNDRPAATEGLDAVRAQIDAIDDALLDLIENRLAISAAVAASKNEADNGHLWLNPRREAAIIARLSGQAAKARPDLIERIWRELMGASLQAQRRTEIVVPAAALERLAPLLRSRFGSAAPLRAAADAEAALAAAAEGQVVAILPSGDTVALPDGLSAFDGIRDDGGAEVAVAVGRIAPGELPAA